MFWQVFVECSGKEDAHPDKFPQSRLATLLDRYENTIKLVVSLPTYVPTRAYLFTNYYVLNLAIHD